MDGSPVSEHELLSRLGLSDGASEDQVETAHSEVVAFLAGAPADLRDWARSQLAAADEAYALLSDRAGSLQSRPRPAAKPVKQSVQPPRRTLPARAIQQGVAEEPRQPFLSRIGRVGRVAITTIALAGVLVGAYVVYASDLPSVPGLSGTPAPGGQQTALDTARVAELMQTIADNPSDIAAFQELGDLYFTARDYQTAAQWEQRVLDIDPNDVTAHLALGAAQYNLGNSADAESHWRRVIELNPNDTDALVEAHYDLGFMYFSANPPDVDKTIAEWEQVIELAPDSDIAQTVAAHLQTLEQWNASGSPTTSGSPSPTSAATPTPAATAQPTATAGQ
jgi:tetratricopeptide (TPR) repeat protein